MAENTKIEWAHHTFNPWIGCTKVGPGCDHCYAEGWAKRSGLVQWGPGAERRRTSDANWRKPLKWNAEAERLGVRFRVFCASLADVFDNEVPAEWRADLFDLIGKTPSLDWLLVTKRIGNAKTMMADALHLNPAALSNGQIWPLPNVWLGITVVNQAEADRDIPKLLQTPAAVRFLSVEPMLGQVSFRWMPAWPENKANRALNPAGGTDHLDGLRRLDWVIVGGESGPKARPMHPQWARDIRDQCEAAGVPFLFKQWGEFANAEAASVPLNTAYESKAGGWVSKTGTFLLGEAAFPSRAEDLHVFRVGKKAAGRLLDGCEHNGSPEVTP